MKIAVAGLAGFLAMGCGPDSAGEKSRTSPPDARTAARAAANAPPDSQFVRFLSLAISTREIRREMFDAVYTRVGRALAPGEIEDIAGSCPEHWQEARWLADYRVLSVTTRGDSADAIAEITTVAREVADWPRRLAKVDIAVDTAHWLLIRSDVTEGLWKVCGDAEEGFGLFQVAPAQVEWSNNGSVGRARAAVDSIRTARRLPLAR